MTDLSKLKNTHRPKEKVQRIGRGMGSGRGKTSCRGGKGDSARTGFVMRIGNEGGRLPLYRKLPTRGFNSERFRIRRETYAINLSTIEQLFKDGETVNAQTLREKGYAPRRMAGGLKILGQGDLTKKITIEAHHFSKSAIEKLEKLSISYKVLSA